MRATLAAGRTDRDRDDGDRLVGAWRALADVTDRSPHMSRRRRSCSPPARANAHAQLGWCPATGRTACSRPGSSSSGRTCTACRSGSRAIVVGAEHVSYSAVLTLRSAGVRTVAMVTDLTAPPDVRAFAAGDSLGPAGAAVDRHRGRGDPRPRPGREVELHNARSGGTRSRSPSTPWCSPATGSPTTSWPGPAGVALDPRSKGPVVDAEGASSIERIYAAGNLVHPAETADIAALRGAAVGAALARRLRQPRDSTVRRGRHRG